MKKILLILVFLCVQNVLSQVITTSLKANDVINFISNPSVEWAIPISENQTIPMVWQERQSSFKDDGFRVFVGYHENTYMATMSIESGNVYGSVYHNGEKILLETSKDGWLIIKKQNTHLSCGVNEEPHLPSQKLENDVIKTNSNKNGISNQIKSDGVLRIYRLALPISYQYFKENYNSDYKQVKHFWIEAETFLNEVYTRDIGVKFKVIDNEGLIMKSTESDPFYNKTISQIIGISTGIINNILGENNYDLGLVVTKSINPQYTGLADLEGAYKKRSKGAAMATNEFPTIGHEIGHLFGSIHTFTDGGYNTYYTEVGRGQSIMSYGRSHPRDFFSLVSILKIRDLLNNTPYYSNIQTKNLVAGIRYIDNIPHGIKSKNTPPTINTEKIQNSYTIPKESFFQFKIPATDAEQANLYYYAHPADIRASSPSNAKFLTLKPQYKNNEVHFQTSYHKTNFLKILHSTPKDIGEFTFWLGVSDFDPKSNNHGSMYDMYTTKVKITDGLPFKIKSDIKKEYRAGEKVTITWDVDDKLFPKGSKVRILLSDDFGETFNHTLASSVDNNGKYEVTLPMINIGSTTFTHNNYGDFTHGNGLFKIEVIDHIVYALTDNNPNGGGFEIKNATSTQEISINIQTDECQFTFTDKHDLTKEQLGDDSVLNLKIIEINGVPQNNLNSLKGIQPKTGENIILWKADNGGVFTQKINVARGDCYKDGKIGKTLPSSTLISTLDKEIKQIDIPNGLLVLESKTKGLVITRIIKGKNISDITNPIEGMIVFDENSNCIKLYNGKQWDCIKQKAISTN